MPKKDFKNPALDFISDLEPKADMTTAGAPAPIPSGYMIMPEVKSERLQLLIKPATKQAMKAEAIRAGKSVNALINEILEDHINRKGKV